MEMAENNWSSVTFSAHSWSGESNATTEMSSGNPVDQFNLALSPHNSMSVVAISLLCRYPGE